MTEKTKVYMTKYDLTEGIGTLEERKKMISKKYGQKA